MTIWENDNFVQFTNNYITLNNILIFHIGRCLRLQFCVELEFIVAFLCCHFAFLNFLLVWGVRSLPFTLVLVNVLEFLILISIMIYM